VQARSCQTVPRSPSSPCSLYFSLDDPGGFCYTLPVCLLGDRLMAGRQSLNLSIKVRILVPEFFLPATSFYVILSSEKKTMPNLHILIFHEGDFWFAVCLDSFMVVKDKEFSSVIPKLLRHFQQHIAIAKHEGAEPFTCFPPAPQEYWDRFQAASWRLSPVVADENPQEVRIAA
jgi:hypothetical protein